MDYRIQRFLNDWINQNLKAGSYDRVVIAGGVLDEYDVLRHVDIAVRLHQIQNVVFINHEDCGAYGIEGNDERHEVDLRKVREKINKLFPHLKVDLFYLNLNGTFEHIT
jgi:carbonic anhydrase